MGGGGGGGGGGGLNDLTSYTGDKVGFRPSVVTDPIEAIDIFMTELARMITPRNPVYGPKTKKN